MEPTGARRAGVPLPLWALDVELRAVVRAAPTRDAVALIDDSAGGS